MNSYTRKEKKPIFLNLFISLVCGYFYLRRKEMDWNGRQILLSLVITRMEIVLQLFAFMYGKCTCNTRYSITNNNTFNYYTRWNKIWIHLYECILQQDLHYYIDPDQETIPKSKCSSYDQDAQYDTLNGAKEQCNLTSECTMVYWNGSSPDSNYFYLCLKDATVEETSSHKCVFNITASYIQLL